MQFHSNIKRREPRYSLDKEVRYIFNANSLDGERAGHIVNISNTGLCLSTDYPLPVGQKLTFTTILPNELQRANVRWVNKMEPHNYFLTGLLCTDAEGDETKEQLIRQLAELHKVGSDVSSNLALDHVVTHALREMVTFTGSDCSFLHLKQDDQLFLKGLWPDTETCDSVSPEIIKVGECLCGLAAGHEKPVYSLDIFSDSRCTLNECKKAGFRSFAAFPLNGRGGVLGVLSMASLREYDFSRQKYFLEILASQIAIALQNSLAYEQLQHQAEALTKHLEERQRTEMALRQSEEIFRRMIETAQEGVCVIDAHARITYANKRMTEMLAYSEGEMMGRSPFDYLHEDDRDKARQSFEGRRQGIKEVFDVRFVRKDGSYCWGIVSATPIMDDQGRLTGSFSMITDITEHKRAVESLRESEERLRLALMAANQGLYDLNVQTGEAKVNEEYALMLGYDPSDFRETNSKWIERLHPDDRERIAGEYRSYIEGKISAYEVEFRQRTKSGDWKWILSLGKIVEWDSEGKPLRMLGTHTDITDRKRAEEENQKLQAQLMHAQKMEAVGQLAGGIAHDFNNILTAIIGYGNIIQMKMDKDDPLQVNLDSILAAAEKAAVLTQSLLAFSRKQIIQTKPVDLNKIVRNIEKILIRIIGEDIELRTKLAIEELNVLADSSQLEQVIMNLATNARDAMPNGGTLSLETGRTELGAEFKRTHGFGEPGRYALLTVSDTGEGMDEETKKRIFEPFFTTKEVGKGTGLGLAMVYGIIKQHAGFINVISKSGKGTAFIVYFPLIEPEREEKRPEELLSPKRGTETILIAEDDETIRVLTGEVLKQFGYSIIEAKDGKDAIQKFMEHRDKIHLLILDLIMPEKNGKEAYDEIRKSRPDIKVLFVSGYAADIIQKKGILNQGLHFVFKPISPVHLLKKVREVLDKKNYIFPL